MQHFTKLVVWQQAHAIAVRIYRITKDFPPDERFGLTSQLRRAAVSVAANLAEGSKRTTDRDFAHFVNISQTSAAEVEYFILLTKDLGILNAELADELTSELEVLQRRFAKLYQRLTGRRTGPTTRTASPSALSP